jgi:methionine-rich copper-binding protein CopC
MEIPMKQTVRTTALLAVALVSASVFAHARLQASSPANASTVSPAPRELRLQYNEAVEAPLCSVKVIGPSDAEVPTDRVAGDKADPKTLVLALPKLAAGDYRVEWSAAGRDGHRTKGGIHFTVK